MHGRSAGSGFDSAPFERLIGLVLRSLRIKRLLFGASGIGALLALSLLICSTSAVIAAQTESFVAQYDAKGELVYRQRDTNNVVRFEQKWYFDLAESTAGQWRLKIDTTYPDPKMRIRSSEIIAFDGTNIYDLNRSPDKVVAAQGTEPIVLPNTNGDAAAQIGPGPFPIDSSSAVGLIWLVFLGGNYLNVARHNARIPDLTVTAARRDPLAWICDFQYELVAGGQHELIKSGAFRLNTNYLSKSFSDIPELDVPQGEQASGRYGATIAAVQKLSGDMLARSSFQVDHFEATHGLSIPQQFHCLLAAPPEAVLELGNNYPPMTLDGTVTNITFDVTMGLIPDITGRTTVADRRFRVRSEDHFRRYVSYELDTNGWIMDTNDATLIKAVARRAPQPIRFSRRPLWHKVTSVCLVVVLLLPVVYLFTARKRPKSI